MRLTASSEDEKGLSLLFRGKMTGPVMFLGEGDLHPEINRGSEGKAGTF